MAEDFADQVGEELARRRHLGDDAPDDDTTALMRACLDGREVAGAEIVSIVRNWTMGEVTTISAGVAIVVRQLAHHPGIQDDLRAGLDDVSPAIDEILRAQVW